MPDHLHAILELRSHHSDERPRAPAGSAGGIGIIVGLFKRGVSLEILQRGIGHDQPLWQRGYYDRVIRSDKELSETRRYIQENALAVVVGPRPTSRDPTWKRGLQ